MLVILVVLAIVLVEVLFGGGGACHFGNLGHLNTPPRTPRPPARIVWGLGLGFRAFKGVLAYKPAAKGFWGLGFRITCA